MGHIVNTIGIHESEITIRNRFKSANRKSYEILWNRNVAKKMDCNAILFFLLHSLSLGHNYFLLVSSKPLIFSYWFMKPLCFAILLFSTNSRIKILIVSFFIICSLCCQNKTGLQLLCSATVLNVSLEFNIKKILNII